MGRSAAAFMFTFKVTLNHTQKSGNKHSQDNMDEEDGCKDTQIIHREPPTSRGLQILISCGLILLLFLNNNQTT